MFFSTCERCVGFILTIICPPPDPEIPQNFRMTSWNSSSISLAWASPDNHKYSLFLLTTFYLNGTDRIIKKVPFWHNEDNFVFTLSDLQPCSRVKFGLQTVCQEGMDSRHSNMVMNAGNSRKASTSSSNICVYPFYLVVNISFICFM